MAAREIAEAAQTLGQGDDMTVVTLSLGLCNHGIDSMMTWQSYPSSWTGQVSRVASHQQLSGIVRSDGAGDRDRTGDIQLGKLTFCH
jgi:hypothetical protein